jgi:hypothetical protein
VEYKKKKCRARITLAGNVKRITAVHWWRKEQEELVSTYQDKNKIKLFGAFILLTVGFHSSSLL